jgi:hypothetical protein
MRKYILIIFLFLSAMMDAQPGRERVEALRVNFIEKKMQFSSSEAEKFWPMYNEYNDKVREIRKALRLLYLRHGENPGEREAEEIVKLEAKTHQAEVDVHMHYGERLRTLLGNVRYVKLRIAEEQFRRQLLKAID